MTEPSLLAAHVPLEKDAFDRFLKTIAPVFAEPAASIIVDRSEDWLILRYLKSEAAAFLAFIYNWGDTGEEIMARPYFDAFLKIADFMPEGASGRLLISAGAMNFLTDPIDAAFTLTKKGGARRDDDGLDEDEKKRFDALLNKYMFGSKPYEQPYQEAIGRSTVLGARIRRRVRTLIETRRREIARERLPQATLLRPVRLFEGFHYNGHFTTHYDTGRLWPLPGFDAFTAEQTSWGAKDARHAVVGRRLIETDPASFRAIPTEPEMERCLYRDDRQVYTPTGEVISGADPESFEYVGGGYARDKRRWYTIEGTVLDDVGKEGHVDTRLYYTRDALLIGERAVYLGGKPLPVDPGSVEVVRLERVRQRGMREHSLGWLVDRDGALIIHDVISAFKEPEWQRTDDPEALWDALKEADEKTLLPPLPRELHEFEAICPKDDPDPAQLQLIAEFGAGWFARNTEAFLAERPFDDRFWWLMVKYFYACWTLGRGDDIVELYERVAADAWWNPYVFHHAACAYVAAGDHQPALKAVYLALACGYDRIDDMLVDQDLSPLFSRDEFQRLKAFREANKQVRRPFLPLVALQSLATRAFDDGAMSLVWSLTNRFFIPDRAALENRLPDQEIRNLYRQLLLQVADDLVRAQWDGTDEIRLDKRFYRRIRDIEGLSPAVHLAGALFLFSEGFFWVDMKRDDNEERGEFVEAVEALGRMRQALAENPAAAEDALWMDLSTHAFVAPFVALADAGGHRGAHRDRPDRGQ
ncbi:DKNYY domain-containing protein [Afifella sp. H1R]|uniref:DKNYY domain-containing protein n=1 Tax=Afifella sp. H1R TaxID=2908841 RepID=UPI001F2EAD8D|nr:DKNYY domain-containing protein [Afifella sp. H1R]MCF1503474.1 DKNYY domain-containing protein [Afifella sp. H1R]